MSAGPLSPASLAPSYHDIIAGVVNLLTASQPFLLEYWDSEGTSAPLLTSLAPTPSVSSRIIRLCAGVTGPPSPSPHPLPPHPPISAAAPMTPPVPNRESRGYTPPQHAASRLLTDQAPHQNVADRSQAAALRQWRAEHQAAPGPLSPLARQTLFDLCRDDSDKGLRELRTVQPPVIPALPGPAPPTKFPLIRGSLYSSPAPRSSRAPSQESGPKMRFFSRPGGFSNIRASLGLALPDPAATNRSAPASPRQPLGDRGG